MKVGVTLLIAVALFAAGTIGGAVAAWKISAAQIEELSSALSAAEKDRDKAVEESARTYEAAASILANADRVATLLAELERDAAARAAREREVATTIRRAPPEHNGPLPQVVIDTVASLYASEASP